MATPLLDALDRLNASLENLARALRTGESDQVLAAETPIAEAVHQLRSFPPCSPAEAASLRASLIAIRVSMKQCDALGSCAVDLANAISQAGYGPTGMRLVRPAPAPSVTSRT